MNSVTVNPNLEFRQATVDDSATILTMIKQLADYEKLLHEVSATQADLERCFFSQPAYAHAVLAFYQQQPVGIAIYFFNFSTFLAKPGLYLEDLFVLPEFRGKSIGKQLLLHLATIAKQHGCGRMEWAVLDWNQSAIDFYQSLGASPMEDWTLFRLSGKALNSAASSEKT